MTAVDGSTQLVGLIGWPVSHSFSPVMHNAAAAALRLNWLYVPLPVPPDQVETAVCGLPALGFRGVNVTIPHKQAVMPLLDEINPGARALGAVNTIVVTQNQSTSSTSPSLMGYNTDWSGFLADLAALSVAVAGRDCLVLGAGGSARAVVYALIQAEARVQILARRVAQAEQLVADLRPFCPQGEVRVRPLSQLAAAAQVTAPLIVNTTPLGMKPQVQASIWPSHVPFPTNAFVYDLVYNPLTTRLMRQAQAGGCQAVNGLGMLVHQGAAAFHLWTGQQPDTAVMRQAILNG